jgi:hypothetical protein
MQIASRLRMSKKLPPICAYLALLILSLPVPLLHNHQTAGVIESMRPVMKVDGHWTPMLMPVEILFLRWLGQLSWWIPWIVLGLFIFSFWRESLTRWSTICAVAIGECMFTTFYAWYATWLLGFQWLEWVSRAP